MLGNCAIIAICLYKLIITGSWVLPPKKFKGIS